MVVATGRLANGVIVNHLVNWLSPRKERQCIATGERGALVADTLTGDLTFYANGTFENDWDAVATFRGVNEGDVTRFAIQKRGAAGGRAGALPRRGPRRRRRGHRADVARACRPCASSTPACARPARGARSRCDVTGAPQLRDDRRGGVELVEQ